MKPSTLPQQQYTESFDIAEHFQRYFSVSPATTAELKHAVYRLRYEVYCREFGYEPLENFPDGIEKDEYDSKALHVLVRHKTTGLAAGCTRLITATPETLLPLERHCKDSLNSDYLNELNLPRQSVCEASRLSVSKNFRRRHGRNGKIETHYGTIESLEFSEQEQRTFPFISVSISLATTALTELTGRPYMFAMMEPFLPRLLQRLGYNFQRVGKTTDYHGKRAAYLQETGAVLQNLKPELRDLYCEIRKSLGVFARKAAR